MAYLTEYIAYSSCRRQRPCWEAQKSNSAAFLFRIVAEAMSGPLYRHS